MIVNKLKRALLTILKAAGFICLAIVLVLAGTSVFFFIAGRDIDPPDVSDLLPPAPPPIAPSENMVPILMDATNLLHLTSGDKQVLNSYRNAKWDRKISEGESRVVLTEHEAAERADRILSTNAAVFAALDAALTCPRAQYPAELKVNFPIPESVETPAYSTLWSFEWDAYWYGGLVALHARRLRENARSAEAVEELLRSGEMFARLSYAIESDTCLLSLRGPCQPVAMELVEAVVKDDLPDDTCVRIDAACARWAQMRRKALERSMAYLTEHIRNSFARDRAKMFEQLFPAFSFELPPDYRDCEWAAALAKGVERTVKSFPGYGRYAFQPNRTLCAWASAWREAKVSAFATPFAADDRARLAAREQARDKDFHLLRRNGVGAYALAGYNLVGLWSFVGRSAFWDESNRAAMAIARYRRKHGSLPPTLEALVPEFLDIVPRDPFDAGRPLGYDVDQGTLHTVGADGTFSGKIPKPDARYGGLRGEQYRWIRRIDGQSL